MVVLAAIPSHLFLNHSRWGEATLSPSAFAYARAVAAEGDFRAAAEVLDQALKRAPD
jgi:hypothetical protein